MSSLEQRLQALGRELAFPPEPDLAANARATMRSFPWRWPALAAAIIALAAAFAVPSARTSILRFFHIEGATVERVETLPPAQERSSAGGLGRRVTVREAEQLLGFHLLLPPLGAEPPAYLLDGVLATVILRVDGRPVLLSEYAARDFGLLKKSVGDKTVVEPVRVAGERGLWLEGLLQRERRVPAADGEDPRERPALDARAGHGAARRPDLEGAGTAPCSTNPLIRSPLRGRSASRSAPNTRYMTAAEVHVVSETEMERVEHWRAEELIRAGFDPSDAVALAARHDIDLHFAVELIEQGCPYETALDILI